MTSTGWTGEPPEAEGPALPVTGMLLAQRQRQAGDTLARTQARSWRDDRPDPVPDPDERAANMVARGLVPGQVSDLSRRLGDTLAELQGEREKLGRGARRQAQIRRAHERGQITAFDIARMAGADEGDPGRWSGWSGGRRACGGSWPVPRS